MSDLIVEPKTLRQYAGTRSQAPIRVALRQAADEIERLLSSRAKDVAGITGVLEGLGRHAVSLMEENERLRAALKSCPCPGGGYNGMLDDMEPTVANCIVHGACGCDLGVALGVNQQSTERK